MIDSFGVPYGNRTRVAAVKGRCPRPLDERDADGELVVQRRKRVTVSYWIVGVKSVVHKVHKEL